jgi:hypothetical protein
MDMLTAKQIAEWEVFSSIDPSPEQKKDFRLAYLLMTINNLFVWAHGKKGSKMSKISEFLLDWDPPKEKGTKVQSVEEIKGFLLGFAKKQNTRIRSKTNKIATKNE